MASCRKAALETILSPVRTRHNLILSPGIVLPSGGAGPALWRRFSAPPTMLFPTLRRFCPCACAGPGYGLSFHLYLEKTMPLIHVEMFEGRTPEIKREFVEAITRETCRVLKCEPGAVDIIMRDVKKSDWASGGVIWSEKK
jgi:4-oxalocrotonate tautomerase